jgi:penicillin-binding protein 1A
VRESGFNAPAAGKTGTTNDGADAWFVGYTPDVVAAVWVGYDTPAPIVPHATGGRLAAPVWARIMLRLYQGRPRPAAWAEPPGVVEGWVDPTTGQRLAAGCRPIGGGAWRELFLARHLPAESCPASGNPEVLTAEALPMEGYEEFTGEPDVPPVDVERTRVPVEEDPAAGDAAAEGEDSRGRDALETTEPSPEPTAAPRLRVSPAPRPTPAEQDEPPADEPRAATPAPAAPTPTPTPAAFR